LPVDQVSEVRGKAPDAGSPMLANFSARGPGPDDLGEQRQSSSSSLAARVGGDGTSEVIFRRGVEARKLRRRRIRRELSRLLPAAFRVSVDQRVGTADQIAVIGHQLSPQIE
jgi:hypothetical protein